MILYHGTTLEIRSPEILTDEKGRDLGFAFCSEEAIKQLKFLESYIVEE